MRIESVHKSAGERGIIPAYEIIFNGNTNGINRQLLRPEVLPDTVAHLHPLPEIPRSILAARDLPKQIPVVNQPRRADCERNTVKLHEMEKVSSSHLIDVGVSPR